MHNEVLYAEYEQQCLFDQGSGSRKMSGPNPNTVSIGCKEYKSRWAELHQWSEKGTRPVGTWLMLRPEAPQSTYPYKNTIMWQQ